MNPFTTAQAEDRLGSPFAAGQVIKEAAGEAVHHVFEDAKNLVGAAVSIHSQSRMAQKTGNVRWMYKLRGLAMELAHLASDFVRQAIIIAAAKFVLELCAQIINSVMDSITRRGKPPLDISSPNVVYLQNGRNSAQNHQTNRPVEHINPFANAFANGATSPW